MLKSGPKMDLPGPMIRKPGDIPTPPISRSARQRAMGLIGKRRRPKPKPQSQTLPVTVQDLKDIGLSNFYLDRARTNTLSGATARTRKLIELVRAKVQARMGQQRQPSRSPDDERRHQPELGISRRIMHLHKVPDEFREAAETGDLREVPDSAMRKNIRMLRAAVIKKDREVAARDGPPSPSLGIDGFGSIYISPTMAREHGLPNRFGSQIESGNFHGLPQQLHAKARKARAAIYTKMLKRITIALHDNPLPDGVLPDNSNKLIHVPLTLRIRYGLEGE
jgi:hypothetical protein